MSGTPVRIPFVMTADATGTATYVSQPRPAYWSSLTCSAVSPNGGTWQYGMGGLTVASQQPLTFGIGRVVQMGPVTIAPNETIYVSVSGIKPGDTLAGTLWGVQTTTPDELVAAVGSSPNSYPPLKPQQQISKLSKPGGTQTLTNIRLPPGILALIVASDYNMTVCNVTGEQSGISYGTLPGGSNVPYVMYPVLSAIDVSIQAYIQTFAAANVYFIAVFDQGVVSVLTAGGVGVLPTSISGGQKDSSPGTGQYMTGAPVYVTLTEPLPGGTAAFRYKVATFANVPAIGATSALVAGVANQYIRVFSIDWHISEYVAGAGFYAGYIQDNPVTVNLDILGTDLSATVQPGVSHSKIFPGGLVLPVGSGVQLLNQSSAGTAARFTGSMLYTQY